MSSTSVSSADDIVPSLSETDAESDLGQQNGTEKQPETSGEINQALTTSPASADSSFVSPSTNTSIVTDTETSEISHPTSLSLSDPISSANPSPPSPSDDPVSIDSTESESDDPFAGMLSPKGVVRPSIDLLPPMTVVSPPRKNSAILPMAVIQKTSPTSINLQQSSTLTPTSTSPTSSTPTTNTSSPISKTEEMKSATVDNHLEAKSNSPQNNNDDKGDDSAKSSVKSDMKDSPVEEELERERPRLFIRARSLSVEKQLESIETIEKELNIDPMADDLDDPKPPPLVGATPVNQDDIFSFFTAPLSTKNKDRITRTSSSSTNSTPTSKSKKSSGSSSPYTSPFSPSQFASSILSPKMFFPTNKSGSTPTSSSTSSSSADSSFSSSSSSSSISSSASSDESSSLSLISQPSVSAIVESAEEPVEDEDFGDFIVTSPSQTLTSAIDSKNVNVETISPLVSTGDTSTTVDEENDEFHEFSSPIAAAVLTQPSTEGIVNKSESVDVDNPINQTAMTSSSVPVVTSTTDKERVEEAEEDEWGDFEATPALTTAPVSISDNTATTNSSIVAQNTISPTSVAAVKTEIVQPAVGGDEEDDWGDFDTAASPLTKSPPNEVMNSSTIVAVNDRQLTTKSSSTLNSSNNSSSVDPSLLINSDFLDLQGSAFVSQLNKLTDSTFKYVIDQQKNSRVNNQIDSNVQQFTGPPCVSCGAPTPVVPSNNIHSPIPASSPTPASSTSISASPPFQRLPPRLCLFCGHPFSSAAAHSLGSAGVALHRWKFSTAYLSLFSSLGLPVPTPTTQPIRSSKPEGKSNPSNDNGEEVEEGDGKAADLEESENPLSPRQGTSPISNNSKSKDNNNNNTNGTTNVHGSNEKRSSKSSPNSSIATIPNSNSSTSVATSISVSSSATKSKLPNSTPSPQYSTTSPSTSLTSPPSSTVRSTTPTGGIRITSKSPKISADEAKRAAAAQAAAQVLAAKTPKGAKSGLFSKSASNSNTSSASTASVVVAGGKPTSVNQEKFDLVAVTKKIEELIKGLPNLEFMNTDIKAN